MLSSHDYTKTRADETFVALPISPFWLFQDKMLLKALKKIKINWKPVLKIMNSSTVSRDSPSLKITETDFEEWYASITEMLWFQESYCFAKPKL